MEEFFYRSIYVPDKGMFCHLPKDLSLGQRLKVNMSISSISFHLLS